MIGPKGTDDEPKKPPESRDSIREDEDPTVVHGGFKTIFEILGDSVGILIPDDRS